MTSSPAELERRSKSQGEGEDEPRIGVGELRPGDVLLYHRSSLLGRVMRVFDGSDVSHAALYLGDGVAEATGAGVQGRSLRVSLGDDPDDYIAVHRLVDGEPAHGMGGIVRRARAYLAQHLSYGHSTIALIAFLVLTRKVPLTPKVRVLLRLVLDRAAADLLALAKDGSQRLICSELVYRCFTEAGPAPDGPFAIQIEGATALERVGGGDTETLLDEARELLGKEYESVPQRERGGSDVTEVTDADLDDAARDVLAERERALESNELPLAKDPDLVEALGRFASAVRNSAGEGKDLEGASPFERFAGVVASFVSPGDLRRSRSLRRCGRLVMQDLAVTAPAPPEEGAAPRTVTHEVQGMSAEMASADWELDQAIAANRRVVASRAAGRVASLVRKGEPLPDEQAVSILGRLRRKRFFDEMLELGKALRQNAAEVSLPVARQYAQALIEKGELADALLFLQSLLPRSANDPVQDVEVRGLIGRVHKQRYVDGRVASAADLAQKAAMLKAAVDAYYEVYVRDRASYTWHGINVVALLARGQRDGVAIQAPEDGARLAQEILAAATSKLETDVWNRPTAAEAYLALGRLDEALILLSKHVNSEGVDAFECASTLRQLEQVWQLREDGPGGALVAILRAALLRKQGGETALEAGGLEAALAGTAQQEKVFEKAFGAGRPRALDFYQRGLRTARAVGRVEDQQGAGLGTGFLVRAAELLPARKELAGELVLVTNAHVLGKTDNGALRPGDAAVRFEAVGDLARTLRVTEVLFESPPNDLDVTIARLDAAVPGVDPIALAPRAEPVFDPRAPRPYYVIGYPRGGHLAISMEDCFQVGWEPPKFLHYRTPTEPGSSGSPVFDDQWQLVALHHAAVKDANEGIWIQRVVDAAAAAAPPRAESAPPVSKAALRAGVFVSYSHEDAAWLRRLQKVLAPAARGEEIAIWDDTRLAAGQEWAREIEKAIDVACVAVLLVTPAFLASRFITDEEFPRILEAARKRGIQVVWVPVSHALYEYSPLKDLQAALDPKRPLAALPASKRDAALVEVARTILAAADASRLKNAFSVADQMALATGGMGGNTALPADLAAQARQEGALVAVTDRSGQPVMTIEATEIDEDARGLVAAYEQGMRLAYKRYLAAYPDQFAADAQAAQKAKDLVKDSQRDVCKNLNLILDFLRGMGKPIADHYGHVRAICGGGN